MLVNIGNFLIETPFTGPYFPNTFRGFTKVILAKELILLEPFIIQYKIFDDEFF